MILYWIALVLGGVAVAVPDVAVRSSMGGARSAAVARRNTRLAGIVAVLMFAFLLVFHIHA